MSEHQQPNPLIRGDEVRKLQEPTISHPFNPNSELCGVSLSDQVGMQRVGFHLVRIPPGEKSFIYHSRQFEEEFIYVLSGRGIAEIDDEEFEVGVGDFMGFPTPSVAHHLRTTFNEDLVYLMGGERRGDCRFSRLKKRLFVKGKEARVADWDDLKSLWNNANQDGNK